MINDRNNLSFVQFSDSLVVSRKQFVQRIRCSSSSSDGGSHCRN